MNWLGRRAARLAAHDRRLWPRPRLLSRFSDRAYRRAADSGHAERADCRPISGPISPIAPREVERSSVARGLSVVRGFIRFLERRGLASCPALAVLRAPKLPRAVPKPLSVADAAEMIEAPAGIAAERVAGQARHRRADAALRLRAAHLGGARADARRRAARRADHDHRQGQQAAAGPGVAGGAPGRGGLSRRLPLSAAAGRPAFVGARGGPLSPRIVQRQMETLRRALGLPETATPHALRHSFATHLLGRRRRSARDPGIAGPRQPVDDAALHLGRQRAPARGLRGGAPAGTRPNNRARTAE